MMKRFVAIMLTVILAWSSGLWGLAEAYAAAQPIVIEKTNEYTIWQNADGTQTLRMEYSVEDALAPVELEAWLDNGDSWTSDGTIANTELEKIYQKNEPLVTLSRAGTSISFAPIMNEEESIDPFVEVAEAYQVSETQTSSNALRVGAKKKRRPEQIEGMLSGATIRFGTESAGTDAGTPAVYDALFDEESSVELIALGGGVKENIIVSAYTGNHAYAYRMEVRGLTAEQSGQEILLSDGTGAVVAQVFAPNMSDANGAYSEDIAVSLESEGSGAYLLTYIPSDEWMQNAAYPVCIDPTANYLNENMGLIGLSYVSSAEPNKNFQYEQYGSYMAKVGRNNHSTYYLYVCPVLRGSDLANGGGSPFPNGSNILIKSASWTVCRWWINPGYGYGTFNIVWTKNGILQKSPTTIARVSLRRSMPPTH